jgi:hypothetical protein
MRQFFESLGQVIGLIMGSNFTVPCDEIVTCYRFPRLEY